MPSIRPEKPLLLVSVAALVNPQGLILLTQRPKGKSMPDLWEFPGGKLERGETPKDALIRELREEINIDVSPKDLHPISFVDQPLKNALLILFLFMTRRWNEEIVPQERQKAAWIAPENLNAYSMPPASVPLIRPLRACLTDPL